MLKGVHRPVTQLSAIWAWATDSDPFLSGPIDGGLGLVSLSLPIFRLKRLRLSLSGLSPILDVK